MTVVQAHLLCLALVLADLVARAWRIQWILRGLDHPVGFSDAFVLNAFGDAACALTPLRIGGEPARLAGMLRSRVPATAAFVAISLEVLAAWPVILVAAGWLRLALRAGVVASGGPPARRGGGPGVALGSARGGHEHRGVALRARNRLAGHAPRAAAGASGHGLLAADAPLAAAGEPAVERRRTWRPGWPSCPVLASTLPEPPALGPMLLGSFALLYSQLSFPRLRARVPWSWAFSAGPPGTWADARAGCCWPGGSTPTASASCSASRSRPTSTVGPRSAG